MISYNLQWRTLSDMAQGVLVRYIRDAATNSTPRFVWIHKGIAIAPYITIHQNDYLTLTVGELWLVWAMDGADLFRPYMEGRVAITNHANPGPMGSMYVPSKWPLDLIGWLAYAKHYDDWWEGRLDN